MCNSTQRANLLILFLKTYEEKQSFKIGQHFLSADPFCGVDLSAAEWIKKYQTLRDRGGLAKFQRLCKTLVRG